MNKKILIADDEDVIRKTICRTLENKPYSVVVTTNGSEAIEGAHREKPDLILLDVQMPLKDGRQVLQELRMDEETKKIPVIMLTGLGEMMDKIVGYELGADDYVTKPFDPNVLLKRIHSILNR